MCLGKSGSENMRMANQCLIQFDTYATKGNTPLIKPGEPETRGEMAQRPRIKSNTTS